MASGRRVKVVASTPATDHKQPVSLDNVTVRVPIDIQSQFRPLLDSTVTNLATAATYTSSAIDVTDLKELTLVIFCNEACEWKVEQSADSGTNWDVVPAVTTRTAALKDAIAPITIVGNRVRWTLKNNGASTSTALRGYVYGRTV